MDEIGMVIQRMEKRRLGSWGPEVSPVGYGALKIGRNQKVKYSTPYELPAETDVENLLNGLLDLGIDYIDTAPAYGLSEERIGKVLAPRRREFTLSTKVGESFDQGKSTFDFTSSAIERSIHRSLQRLHTDFLDVVFLHSHGDDLAILNDSDAVSTLMRFRDSGKVTSIGLSAKTVAGARASLAWADCLMIEYHLEDRSQEPVIAEASASGVGVVVKKPLASGRLSPAESLRFIMDNPGVSALVVGTLNLEHMRANLASLAG